MPNYPFGGNYPRVKNHCFTVYTKNKKSKNKEIKYIIIIYKKLTQTKNTQQ